jgi:fructan beta-fructosidase
MALPRGLWLKRSGNTWILLERPLLALESLRGEATEWQNKTVSGTEKFPYKGQVFELDAELEPARNGNCGVRLAVGGGQAIIIGYDARNEKLYLDRSKSGNTSFDNHFTAWQYKAVRVPLQEGKLRLHVFFDKSIMEVFANDGSVVLTAQLFPDISHDGIEFFSEKGATRIPAAKVWPLKSAWQ